MKKLVTLYCYTIFVSSSLQTDVVYRSLHRGKPEVSASGALEPVRIGFAEVSEFFADAAAQGKESKRTADVKSKEKQLSNAFVK